PEQGNAGVNHPGGRQEILNDAFHQGIGFGFKSRTLETRDNVAVSSNGAGYSFWPMGNDDGISDIDPDTAAYEAVNGYNPFFGDDTETLSEVPLRVFDNNEALVAHVGFNTSGDKRGTEGDITSVVDGFVAWEVAAGVTGFYQNNYLFKENVFVGLADGFTSKHQGISKVGATTTGIVAHDFKFLKIVESSFKGFDQGIFSDTFGGQTEELAHVVYGNTYVDVGQNKVFEGAANLFPFEDDSAGWASKLNVGRLEAYVDAGGSDLVLSSSSDSVRIKVVKTDSIGRETVYEGDKNFWSDNVSQNGYYKENGNYYVLVDVAVGDRLTGSVTVAEVAIRLAFVNSAGDLPSGAVNNGALPAHIAGNGTSAFTVV
ncbi:MAG: hypothetical protein AAGL98_14210, partial [Planctomycetota bacterium]